MPRILFNAFILYLWGVRTELYKRIFEHMTETRLQKCRPLSDKRIVSLSSKYYYARNSFEEREKFMQSIIFQYRGV